eukprot:TRINITY_DN60248_c0_g1_i1.p1 TRINITY_DN60248_c0_g1~~TRINITY_DN60248_c0_g1_i1.p1  ORF type:complete len:355 (+),score=94.75 TRINITY_DN60248_c0_g1_i1:74-1066(+)
MPATAGAPQPCMPAAGVCAEALLREHDLGHLVDLLRGARGRGAGEPLTALDLASVSDGELEGLGVRLGARRRFQRVVAVLGQPQQPRAVAERRPPALPDSFPHPQCSVSLAVLALPRDWQDRRRVPAAPPEAHYAPELLSPEQEQGLLDCVEAPCYEEAGKWVSLRERRLQEWGGCPTEGGLLNPERLPPWLRELCDALGRADLWDGLPANHVLVNDYSPGGGIMPHRDGPLYHPAAVIVSLGADAVMEMRPPRDSPAEEDRGAARILLRRRSLFSFRGDAYRRWEHGILSADRGGGDPLDCVNAAAAGAEPLDSRRRRVSLTIRHVLRP